jgi:hypothetical protein
MAFIRWKVSRQGMRRAYLVHSYRDEQGKPRHKTLAYLGAEGELTPERLTQLKEKHKDLSIHWEGIAPSAKPARSLDPASLSDEELLRNLKTLRLEKGLNIQAMVQAVLDAGLPPWKTGHEDRIFTPYLYKGIEREAANGPLEHFLAKIAPDILPYFRKVLAF